MTLTAERLRELLHYDPETGTFTRRVTTSSRAIAGDVAGTGNDRGYTRLKVNNRSYRAHRLAWLYMTGEWPELQIDHVNGDRADNRWANLREAAPHQNRANSKPTIRNKCGIKGVRWHYGKWSVEITAKGIRHYIGRFNKLSEAAEAYAAAADRYHGEFARVK